MGEWDCGLVAQQAMVDFEDETRFYYLASSVGNAGGCHYRTGVARITRDRFAYRCIRVMRDYKSIQDKTAAFSLKDMTLPENPKISLNVSNLNSDKSVRCEIRDAEGNVIPGFSMEACRRITEDAVRAPVEWENADVRTLAGQNVVLRIEMRSIKCQFGERDSPRVYALYTQAPK